VSPPTAPGRNDALRLPRGPSGRAAGKALARGLLALAVLALAARTAAAGPLEDLVERWRSVSGRQDDAGHEVQREALEKIADLETDASRRALKSLHAEAKGGDARRTALVLAAIVRRGGPAEVDYVVKAAEASRDPALVAGLARVLAGARRPDARAHLRGEALQRASPPFRAQIARAFGAMGDPEAAMSLIVLLRDEDLGVRTEALLALGELRDPATWHEVARFLRAPDPRVREVAARSLGVLGAKDAAGDLVRSLADPAPRVVESAANALALLEAAAGVEPLIERLSSKPDEDLRVLDALVRALERLTGRTLGDDPELWRAWWKEAKKGDGAPPKAGAPTTVAGPRYYGMGVRSQRVVFVIDVSRSMGWNGRLETAQRELQQALERLPARTKFDVVTFSDFAQAWAGKLGAATPETVRRAVRFVERLEPQSGTNAYDGLKKAFEDEEADTVFFLSDGSPTVGPVVDPERILADVREWNRWRRVRIHAIALLRGEPPPFAGASEDPGAAASFLKRLAEENDGHFREVR
jgi:HEAT repeat protein